ncbi:hypothetical protein N9B31_09060 [Mariniblastus sp.]|nr:hypothetical protein [Mariniblastus sp.]
MDEQGQDSHKSDEWRKIAGEVDSLIRTYGIEPFRDQTRQAASEYVAARKKCKSREERRLDELKKNGVLHGVEDLPDRPDDYKTKWVAWKVRIRGRLKEPIDIELSTPPQRPDVPDEFDPFPPGELGDRQLERLDSFKSQLNGWKQVNDKYWRSKSAKESRLADFRLIKERGFPDETIPENTKRYFKYDFEVQCLIPVELSPGCDPNTDQPLPVPDRELKLAEKFAGLSALHDAFWKGGTKIAPWGMMPDEAEPRSGLPPSGVSEDESRQAGWYDFLLLTAKELDVGEIPIVRSWLADVESEQLKEKATPKRDTQSNKSIRKRRNLGSNEITDTEELLVAGLKIWHDFDLESLSIGHLQACSYRGLEKLTKVPKGKTMSNFFKKCFGSNEAYRKLCKDQKSLAYGLAKLSREGSNALLSLSAEMIANLKKENQSN